LFEAVDSNTSFWTKPLNRLHCASREVHRAGSPSVNESRRRAFLRHPERSRGIPRHYR